MWKCFDFFLFSFCAKFNGCVLYSTRPDGLGLADYCLLVHTIVPVPVPVTAVPIVYV